MSICLQAGATALIVEARTRWDKNQPFFYLTKLLLLCQTCRDDQDRLKFLCELYFVRMLRGSLQHSSISQSCMKRELLQAGAVVFDLCKFMHEAFQNGFEQSLHVWLLSPIAFNTSLPKNNPCAGKAMIGFNLIAKKLVGFLTDLIDAVWGTS